MPGSDWVVDVYHAAGSLSPDVMEKVEEVHRRLGGRGVTARSLKPAGWTREQLARIHPSA